VRLVGYLIRVICLLYRDQQLLMFVCGAKLTWFYCTIGSLRPVFNSCKWCNFSCWLIIGEEKWLTAKITDKREIQQKKYLS